VVVEYQLGFERMMKALQQQGMLRVLVLLQGCAEPGRVRQIDEL